MKRLNLLIGAACVLAGAVFGYFLCERTQDADPVPLSDSRDPAQGVSLPAELDPSGHSTDYRNVLEQVASLEAQLAEAREENSRLRTGNGELADRMDIGFAREASTDQTKYVVPKHILMNLSFPSIKEDYSLTSEFIEIPGISKAEENVINDAILHARAELDELELQHTQSTTDSESRIVVDIGPFEESAEAVKSTLIANVQAVLGQDRGELLVHSIERDDGSTASLFSYWGRTLQSIVVTRTETGEFRFDREYWYREAPQMGGSSSRTYNSIPDKYVHLFELAQ